MNLAENVSQEDHALGSLTANVVVMLYADFECPYSKKAHRVLKELASWYGNLISIVFRHFPRPSSHPNARLAAEAAEAAHSQGLFWEMQDYLFENQQLLDRQHLLRYATSLGLDVAQFIAELDANVHQDRINRDVVSAEARGVRSAPAVFVNARRLGIWELDDVFEAVHCELNRPIAVEGGRKSAAK